MFYISQLDPNYKPKFEETLKPGSLGVYYKNLISGLNILLHDELVKYRNQTQGQNPSWYETYRNSGDFEDGLPKITCGKGSFVNLKTICDKVC